MPIEDSALSQGLSGSSRSSSELRPNVAAGAVAEAECIDSILQGYAQR
jgi:hypothetical protein